MKISVLVTALALGGEVALAAPARVATPAIQARAVTTATATTTSSTSTATSTGFSLASLLSSSNISKVSSYIESLLGLSDSSSSSSTASSTTTLATSTATSLLSLSASSIWKLLSGLFDSDDSDDSSSSSSTTTAATATATTAKTTSKTTAKTTSQTTTSSTSSSTSSSSIYDEIADCTDIDEDFAKDTLDIHNQYRALHSAGDLSWSADAYAYAKNVADSYDCSGVLTHTDGDYGENLACGYSSGPASVTAWYDEGDSYDYSTADTYNHFTQVVWKSSTKLGCAYKDCTDYNWGLYVICEYDPAGNVIGEEALNVLPLVSSSTSTSTSTSTS